MCTLWQTLAGYTVRSSDCKGQIVTSSDNGALLAQLVIISITWPCTVKCNFADLLLCKQSFEVGALSQAIMYIVVDTKSPGDH